MTVVYYVVKFLFCENWLAESYCYGFLGQKNKRNGFVAKLVSNPQPLG